MLARLIILGSLKGKKPRTKAPRIQRLVTPRVLQHKRRRIALKRQRTQKNKEEASEYAKLLAKRMKVIFFLPKWLLCLFKFSDYWGCFVKDLCCSKEMLSFVYHIKTSAYVSKETVSIPIGSEQFADWVT